MSNEIIVLSKEEVKVLVREVVEEVLAENTKRETEKVVKEVAEEVTGKSTEETVTETVKETVSEVKPTTEIIETNEEVEEETNELLEEIKTLSYNELKKRCKELGLNAGGKKEALVERLLEAQEAQEVLEGSESDEDVEGTDNTNSDTEPSTEADKAIEKASEEEEVEEDAEIEENSENEEEESFETLTSEQIEDIVKDLKKDELCAIIDEMGVDLPKYTKKKALDIIVNGGQDTIYALVLLGYVDSDEEEEVEIEIGEEEVSLADDLAEFDTEELAEICSEYELSVKGKKQALIDRVVKAVEDGIIDENDLFEYEEYDENEENNEEVENNEEDEVIDADYEEVEEYNEVEDNNDQNEEADNEEIEEVDEWYTREELDELNILDLKDIANENSLDIPTKQVKKAGRVITSTDREALIEAILALGEEEVEEENNEVSGGYVPKEERIVKEEEIEKALRAEYRAKKIKDVDIKNFLVKYNEGNPDFKYSDLTKKEALEQYIDAKVGLVDDDGYEMNPEQAYLRDNEFYCCAKELIPRGETYYCEVCGNEYEL